MSNADNSFLPGLSGAAPGMAPNVVLPVPYERTTSFGKGAVSGPAAIIGASRHVELFDEELLLPMEFAVETLPAVDCANGNDEQALLRIYETASAVIESGRFLLSLGGEHTIAAPLIEAALRHAGELSVLQIDAHSDLREEYTGTRFSHGCAMRRALELGVRLVAAGIRSFSREEHEFMRTRKIPVFMARDIASARDEAWMDDLINELGPNVYLTVDIDGLDVGAAPGTGTPEPGGLGWYPLLRLLRKLFAARRLPAADIVEVSPVPGQVVTEYTAARLGAKILFYRSLACSGRLPG